MKFKYSTVFEERSTIAKLSRRPVVEIDLFGPKGKITIANALVDSGADISIFNSAFAKAVGIDLGKPTRSFTGIGGPIAGYEKEIEMQLRGDEKRIKILTAFTDSPFVVALLGEEGFFDKYRIKFERDRDNFEINPSSGD